MTGGEINMFLWGALAMAPGAVGLFFLRFWRQSNDRLFVFFTLAFWVLSINWIGLAIVKPGIETHHYFFVLRLIAFVAIIAGIVDKNRR